MIANESRESGSTEASSINGVASASARADAATGAVLSKGAAGAGIATGAADPSRGAGARASYPIAGCSEIGEVQKRERHDVKL